MSKHKQRPSAAAEIVRRCTAIMAEMSAAPAVADPILTGFSEWLSKTREGRALLHATSETVAQIVAQLSEAAGRNKPDIPGAVDPEILTTAIVAVYSNLMFFGYQVATQPRKETVN